MREQDVSIMLDEDCFRCLVRGGIVHIGKIRIALQDIGFDRMDDAITSADNGIDIYKDYHKNEI